MFWKKKKIIKEESKKELPKPIKYKEISTNNLIIQTKSSYKMSWTVKPL